MLEGFCMSSRVYQVKFTGLLMRSSRRSCWVWWRVKRCAWDGRYKAWLACGMWKSWSRCLGVTAVRQVVVLSDRVEGEELDAARPPLPTLLAVGAVHHHLIR